MKSFKYLAAAALTFLAVGCNKEQVTEVPDGQVVDVMFTAALPGEIATKAIGDGQTAKTLYVSVYENDDAKTKLELDKTATFTDLKTQVTFSLVKGKTYNFVFWAQAEGATCYDIDDLKNIKISYEGAVANDETRDAFYATRKELKVNGALTETIKLYRPFAQVNFGTADLFDAAAAGFIPAQSAFTATDVANVFDTFNAEGKVEGTATDKVTFAKAEIPGGGETLVTKDGTKYLWMTMNYIIPVGKQDEKHISNVTAEFVPATGDAITASSPQTPVQNNYRTNILGNLLTSQVIFNVEIVPIFNEPDNDIDLVNIKNVESLKALFATGGEATLAADLVLDEAVAVMPGKEVTLDLNGKTIKNNSNSVALDVYGSLVINGEGTVDGGEGGHNVAVWSRPGAKLIINGGTYTVGADANGSGNSTIYTTGGDVIINGGTFSTAAKYGGRYWTINKQNGSTGKVEIYGGTFPGFDPANPNTDDETTYVADGYKSVKKGDSYVVMPENQSIVATAAELDEAIAAVAEGVKSEIILNAGTYDNVIDLTDKEKVITFKPANGAEVVLAGVNVQSNNTKTDCVFENITFDNSLQATGWYTGTSQNIYPCVGVWGGKLAFKNCKFIVDGNTGKETGVMTWWTTKECGATLTFDGCSFEGKNNHAEARAMQIYGHVNLDVQNCRLATAKRYAIKYVGNEGYVATIKNCNVSNCKYTVELGSGVYPGSKYVVNFEGNTLAEGIADYKIANAEGATVNGGVAL